jgi:FkbM family methyltransferase
VNSWQVKLRSLARRTGVIGVIHLLRSRLRPAGAYEQCVHEALAGAVRPGDVVWDVGANVGVYTELFCEWVGKDGLVVAFEPFVDSCAHIRERIPDCAWLRVENVALGETDAAGRLMTSADSVENHLATGSSADSAGSVPVTICRGDSICARLGRAPNVIKVDVEGFEEEVLAGMAETLASPDLRSLLVEVHFSKLEQRGRAMAPVRIEKLLRGKGFRTSWVDASHLFATR